MSNFKSSIRFIVRTEQHNGHDSLVVGPTDSYHGRTLYLCSVDGYSHRYVFAFGGFTTTDTTSVLVSGSSFDDALEEAMEYVLDRWPGFDATDSVNEAYAEYLAKHPGDEERAQQHAETDVTSTGDGRYMHSEDWHIAFEDPTREDLESNCYPGGLSAWAGEIGDTMDARDVGPVLATMRAEIAAYLSALDRTPPESLYIDCPDCDGRKIRNPEMVDEDGESFVTMDIRLQIHDRHWTIWTGDSSYDTDHRGAWGCSSVAFVGDDDAGAYDAAKLADELIDSLVEDLDDDEDLRDGEAL